MTAWPCGGIHSTSRREPKPIEVTNFIVCLVDYLEFPHFTALSWTFPDVAYHTSDFRLTERNVPVGRRCCEENYCRGGGGGAPNTLRISLIGFTSKSFGIKNSLSSTFFDKSILVTSTVIFLFLGMLLL